MSVVISNSALPIDAVSDEVCRSLHRGNVVVQAEPAGKSTGLSLRILDAGFSGKILMLEPRRIAAENVASRLAAQLDEPSWKANRTASAWSYRGVSKYPTGSCY